MFNQAEQDTQKALEDFSSAVRKLAEKYGIGLIMYLSKATGETSDEGDKSKNMALVQAQKVQPADAREFGKMLAASKSPVLGDLMIQAYTAERLKSALGGLVVQGISASDAKLLGLDDLVEEMSEEDIQLSTKNSATVH